MAGIGLTMVWILSVMIDAAVMLTALFLPWRAKGLDSAHTLPHSISLSRWAAALAVTFLVFVAKLVVLHPLGLDMFGVIHLLYLDMVIVLPLTGLAMVFYRRKVHKSVWIPVVVSLGLAPIGPVVSFVEPTRLEQTRTVVPVRPERSGKAAIRIGVLADLQTSRVTSYEHQAIDALLAASPDLIVAPGDLFQGTPEAFDRELPALRRLLGRLSAPGGVYLVPGNIDEPEQLARVIEGTTIRLLTNQVARVTLADRRITLIGIDVFNHSADAWRIVDQQEADRGAEDIRILLSHTPDALLALDPHGSRIDLTISGHTHGGQIQLPLVGPLMKLSQVPRHIAAGGYHVLNGNAVYVSRGVGCERGQAPRIRFLCRPEVSLLILESKR